MNNIIKNKQLYYNKKKNGDYIVIIRSHFLKKNNFHVYHLRELGNFFLYRDKYDKSEVITKKELEKSYTLFLTDLKMTGKELYGGEDGLISYVYIYPFPKKLITVLKKHGFIK